MSGVCETRALRYAPGYEAADRGKHGRIHEQHQPGGGLGGGELVAWLLWAFVGNLHEGLGGGYLGDPHGVRVNLVLLGLTNRSRGQPMPRRAARERATSCCSS